VLVPGPTENAALPGALIITTPEPPLPLFPHQAPPPPPPVLAVPFVVACGTAPPGPFEIPGPPPPGVAATVAKPSGELAPPPPPDA
jgi:hypothetical protein